MTKNNKKKNFINEIIIYKYIVRISKNNLKIRHIQIKRKKIDLKMKLDKSSPNIVTVRYMSHILGENSESLDMKVNINKCSSYQFIIII